MSISGLAKDVTSDGDKPLLDGATMGTDGDQGGSAFGLVSGANASTKAVGQIIATTPMVKINGKMVAQNMNPTMNNGPFKPPAGGGGKASEVSVKAVEAQKLKKKEVKPEPPDCEFSVYTQCFAPFETFGFGFEGDGKNRNIGSDPKRFRLSTIAQFAYSKKKFSFIKKIDQKSLSGIVIKTGLIINEQESETESSTIFSGASTTASLSVKAKAGNDATLPAFLSDFLEEYFETDAGDLTGMNIDRQLDLDFTLKKDDKENPIELTVKGACKGEGFPGSEILMTDKRGQMIVLGGSGLNLPAKWVAVPCTFGKVTIHYKEIAPFVFLGKDIFEMFKINVKVKIKNGGFEGVIDKNGKEYSVADWNKEWLKYPIIQLKDASEPPKGALNINEMTEDAWKYLERGSKKLRSIAEWLNLVPKPTGGSSGGGGASTVW